MNTKIVYFGRVQCTSQQYSLLTGRGDDDSLNYGWKNPQLGWLKSSKDGGNQSFDDGPMVPADIPVLLKHFGLSDVRDDRLADFETVRYMSPAVLIGIRRAYEKETGAAYLEVKSDREGGHIPAEMVDCREQAMA